MQTACIQCYRKWKYSAFSAFHSCLAIMPQQVTCEDMTGRPVKKATLGSMPFTFYMFSVELLDLFSLSWSCNLRAVVTG